MPLLTAKEPNPCEKTKKRIRERKQEVKQAKGEEFPDPPPAMVKQIAANRNYYNSVEFYILRSIHGSKW
jgi:hypothetical protein